MAVFNWTCPFCGRDTTITDDNFSRSQHQFYRAKERVDQILVTDVINCPNPECRETAFNAIWCTTGPNYTLGEILDLWPLRPAARMRVFPDYVPAPILEDYREACLIRDLSPKASATLARRCLQGMIRDFWDVRKGRLQDEINGIRDKVDPVIWSAIDTVRSIGNIGAHMEKDINLTQCATLKWLIH